MRKDHKEDTIMEYERMAKQKRETKLQQQEGDELSMLDRFGHVEEADLVLGGDEGKDCTYDNGYMKRQELFSCLTCTPDGNAGVCTACCLSCHDGHEIVELWSKRNFRCDCGNSKFGVFFCKLFANKDVENAGNSYNHNFKGLYCTCARPYPDPDVEVQVGMIQCCVCEDWFHDIGLDCSVEIARDEDGEPLGEDFICKSCSTLCSFLRLYGQTILAAGGQKDTSANTSKNKEVLVDVTVACGSGKLENGISHRSSTSSEPVSDGDGLLLGESSGKNIGVDQCTTDTKPHVTCVLGVNVLVDSPVLECKPMFLSKNWRDALCRCERCSELYEKKHIKFLLDKEDTIMEYERMAKQKREAKLQQQEGDELSMLDRFGHVEKLEILNGIAEIKNELSSFLASFDGSKPITSADVRGMFDNLKKRRRGD